MTDFILGDLQDMVDTTPSNPGQTLDIVKVLMGAINRRVDFKGSAAFQTGK